MPPDLHAAGLGAANLTTPPGEDRHERARAQLLEGEPAPRRRLLLADGAAVDRAQEEVEQALPRRRVVEDVADERRLRRLGDEVGEPLRRRVEAVEEERVDRRVTDGQLRRVQVPALVEAQLERVLDVVVAELPGEIG